MIYAPGPRMAGTDSPGATFANYKNQIDNMIKKEKRFVTEDGMTWSALNEARSHELECLLSQLDGAWNTVSVAAFLNEHADAVRACLPKPARKPRAAKPAKAPKPARKSTAVETGRGAFLDHNAQEAK